MRASCEALTLGCVSIVRGSTRRASLFASTIIFELPVTSYGRAVAWDIGDVGDDLTCSAGLRRCLRRRGTSSPW